MRFEAGWRIWMEVPEMFRMVDRSAQRDLLNLTVLPHDERLAEALILFDDLTRRLLHRKFRKLGERLFFLLAGLLLHERRCFLRLP